MIRNERGVALVVVLIMLAVMTMIGLGITGVGMIANTVTVNARETSNALAIADAGMAHARRILMWQEWPTPNVFLQNAGGVACDGDELSQAPAVTLPTGFPAGAGDFIPAAGRAFGGGSYRVLVCDDTVTDVDPVSGNLDLDPNVDVNRRILVRAIGLGANGATATVEQVFGPIDLPAVIVNGNVRATGNPRFTGAAGAIHGNGNLEVAGNACAQAYFSAVGTLPVTGNSAGGGAACTTAALDTRPDSAPLNVPVIAPDTYKAQADYWLESDGTCTVVATGLQVACAGLGWSYNAGSSMWSGGSSIVQGTYWVNGNVNISGSPGSALVPLPLTILARGHVDVTGNARTRPDLFVSGLGAASVGLGIVAGTDIRFTGNFEQAADNAVYYAAHQVDVTGTPLITGQLMALNLADTPYPNPGGSNLVQLNAAGQMVLSGSPTINFGGNGMQSIRALQWRECRTSNDPDNPCGALFGG